MNFLNLNNASFTMDTLLRIAVYFLQCRLHLIKYVLLGVILTLPLLANAENYSRLFSHDGINPEVLIVTDQNAKLYRIKGPSANIAPMTIMWRLKITDALDSRNPVIERKGKKYYCVGIHVASNVLENEFYSTMITKKRIEMIKKWIEN